MKFKSLRFLAVAALLSMTCTSAWTAVQGTSGGVSTGEMDITVTNGSLVNITGLPNFIGTWGGAGDLNGNVNICIGRSGTGAGGIGNYRILASGDGDPFDVNAFTLSNGIDELHYNFYFNDQTGLTNRQLVTPGLAMIGQTASGNSLRWNIRFGCVIRNANISLEIQDTDLAAVSSGVYTGTLTILVIPE